MAHPHDPDVLVVGQPAQQAVYDRPDCAQQRLGMPVKLMIRTSDACHQAADPFVQQIQSGPLVTVLKPEADTGDECANPGSGDD
jgi:hypothetical protein